MSIDRDDGSGIEAAFKDLTGSVFDDGELEEIEDLIANHPGKECNPYYEELLPISTIEIVDHFQALLESDSLTNDFDLMKKVLDRTLNTGVVGINPDEPVVVCGAVLLADGDKIEAFPGGYKIHGSFGGFFPDERLEIMDFGDGHEVFPVSAEVGLYIRLNAAFIECEVAGEMEPGGDLLVSLVNGRPEIKKKVYRD